MTNAKHQHRIEIRRAGCSNRQRCHACLVLSYEPFAAVLPDGGKADPTDRLVTRLEGVARPFTLLGEPGTVLLQQLGKKPLPLCLGRSQRRFKAGQGMLHLDLRGERHVLGQQQIPDPLGGRHEGAAIVGNKHGARIAAG